MKIIRILFLSVFVMAGPAFAVTENDIPLPSREELLQVMEQDMVTGDKNAPVTIIEYASMTCAHCAAFHNNTYPKIKSEYIETGKVKFIKRAFPLDEVALRASMMAHCTETDEQYYKFIEVLFSTQNNWAMSKNYLEVLSNIGKLGGISGERFEECIADEKLEEEILKSRYFASAVLGVRSTPTFFINGEIVKGAYRFDYFKREIEKQLGEDNL